MALQNAVYKSIATLRQSAFCMALQEKFDFYAYYVSLDIHERHFWIMYSAPACIATTVEGSSEIVIQ